jgi:hypothetical protein
VVLSLLCVCRASQVGKWHLGFRTWRNIPAWRGFGEFFGCVHFYYDGASRVASRLPHVFSPLTQRHTTHQTPAEYHANTPPSPPRHSYCSGILDEGEKKEGKEDAAIVGCMRTRARGSLNDRSFCALDFESSLHEL